MSRRLHLNYFRGHTGDHEAAWRHPGSRPDAVLGAQHLIEVAQLAEAACLGSIFLPHGFTVEGIAHTDYGGSQDPSLPDPDTFSGGVGRMKLVYE